MATPCKIIYKGKTLSYEEFVSMLHDNGMLDQFVKDGIIDNSKFKGNATKKISEQGGVQAERQGGTQVGEKTSTGGRNRLLGTEGGEEKAVEKIAEQAGVKAKNIRDLYNINKSLWGLNRVMALAIAIMQDRLIGQVAKRAGITKEAMYDKIEFKKAQEGELAQVPNVVYQGKLNGQDATFITMPEGLSITDGWYSPIEKRLRETKIEKQSATKWLGIVGGKDEAIYTGVKGWLESKRPDEQVSKQEILDWMKDNRVEIVEVVKGESKTASFNMEDYDSFPKEVSKIFDKYYDDNERLQQELEKKGYEVDVDGDGTINSFWKKGESPVKFSQYQLEGEKENYKEVLVTLPRKADVFKTDNGWAIRLDGEISPGRWNSQSTAQKALNEYNKNRREGIGLNTSDFKSSHFGEPNILVHLRMNTRTDADGNKVLFLEEIQSDWGQEGKKKGFKESAKLEQLKKERDIILDKTWNEGVESISLEEQSRFEQLERDINKLLRVEAIGVESAPFVTDTNAWTKLGLKMALREAVSQGVDKIAWTTGEQQFDRWGTEKIDWVSRGTRTEAETKRMNELGEKIVSMRETPSERKEYETLSNKEGWSINIQEQFKGTAFEGMNIDEKALSEKGVTINSKEELRAAIDRTLSREKTETERQKLTDRIWDRMQKEDSGTSLPRKEGMEAFYDRQVRDVAKALVKDLTGKQIEVGETKIDTKEGTGYELGEANYVGGVGVYDSKGDMVAEFDTKEEAENYIKQKSSTTQQSIDITPELKAQVKKGMPLFQGEKGAMQAMADGSFIIYAITDPNVSTPVHELAHIFEHYLTPEEKASVMAWAGGKEWTTQTSEKFARGFEKYLADGIAPTKGLQKVFDRFKTWLTEIYNGINGSDIDIELNKPMRDLYANMLGEDVVKPKAVEEGGEVSPPTTKEEAKEEPRKERMVAKRIVEGASPEQIQEGLKKHGLKYAPSNQLVAQMKAKDFLKDMGLDATIAAVMDKNTVDGDVRAYLFEQARIELDRLYSIETDPKKAEELQQKSLDLQRVFAEEGTSAGQFIRALAEIYKNSAGYYSAEQNINEYRSKYGKEPSEKDIETFKKIEKENKELTQKINELEAKLEKTEAVDAIKEDIKREKTAKRKYELKYKKIANNVRKTLKGKTIQFKDENGNPIDVTKQALFDWNEIVEFFATSIENTGKLLDAVNNTIEHIKQQDWYRSLSSKNQKAIEKQVKDELYGFSEETKISNRIIREIVERGNVNTIEELVAEVKKELGLDDKSDREVRDAITNYGKVVKMSADETSKALRKMKNIGRLLSQLEDVHNQIRPLKSGLQRDKLTAEERKLQRELREAMKDLPPDEKTLESELKTRLDAAKSRVRNRIEDLEHEIAKGEKVKKSDKAIVSDEELKDMRQRLEELKKEHDEIFKDEAEEYRIKLNQAKQRVKNSIDNYEKRIADGNFASKKKQMIQEDEELSELRAKREAVRDEFEKLKYRQELDNRTSKEKLIDWAIEAWNLPRALRATAEMSFIGLQGAYYTIAHPLDAIKSFKTMIQHMGSEKNALKWLHSLRASKDYPIMKAVKLAIAEPDAKLSAREEQFISGWAAHIWDLMWKPTALVSPKLYEILQNANPIKGFERAAIGYLNTLRVQRFRDGALLLEAQGKNYKDNPKDYEALAELINTMTGRSSLPLGAERVSKLLSLIMFSPRNTMSQIKTSPLGIIPFYMSLGGQETADVGIAKTIKLGATKPSTAQKMLMVDYMKYTLAKAGIFALVAYYLANDDDDETKISYDPTSSDFMKFRMGNKAIDIWNGQVPLFVMQARMINNAINRYYGERKNVIGEYQVDKSLNDVFLNWFKNKYNPTLQLVSKIGSGELRKKPKKEGGGWEYVTPYGEEIDELNTLAGQLYPIYFDTLYELNKDKDNGNTTKAFLTFLSFFNFGNPSYYEEPKTTAEKEASRAKKSGGISTNVGTGVGTGVSTKVQ